MLKETWKNAEYGISIIESLKAQYLFEEEKELIIHNYYPLFEHFIWACLKLSQIEQKLFYQEQAILASGKSKSLFILENIRKKRFLEIGNETVKQLITQEQLIWGNINLLQGKSDKIRSQSEPDQNKLKDFENLISELYSKRKTVLQNLYEENQQVSGLLYESEKLNLVEIQNNFLKPEQLIIEFFEGEDFIFSFFISPSYVHIDILEKTHDFEDHISKVISIVNNPTIETDQLNVEKFIHHSFWLFEKLLSSLSQIEKTNSIRELIIIPDGILHGIPFELLINKKPRNLDQGWLSIVSHYLINEYDFSYLNSMKILREKEKLKEANSKNKFVSLIGEYQNLDRLENSAKIANLVANRLNSDSYQLHSKINFTNYINKSSSFLLVAHTNLNNIDPLSSSIILSDGDLEVSITAMEIHGLNLNSEFGFFMNCGVIGGDPNLRGQGRINLAQAFNVAGIKSSAMSHWDAPDEATSFIIKSFFSHLSNGKSKSQALKLAKLEYINTGISNNDNLIVHPFYWAGFIIQGDSSPLEIKTRFSKDIGFLFLLGAILGLFFLWIVRNKN